MFIKAAAIVLLILGAARVRIMISESQPVTQSTNFCNCEPCTSLDPNALNPMTRSMHVWQVRVFPIFAEPPGEDCDSHGGAERRLRTPGRDVSLQLCFNSAQIMLYGRCVGASRHHRHASAYLLRMALVGHQQPPLGMLSLANSRCCSW